MEARIQYATTSDGVKVAYAVFGDGPPIVFASNIWGDVHLIQTGLLQLKETVEQLVARRRRVIAYDGRGMGSSDRNATDFSPQARVHDLEAVVDRLGMGAFVLFGRDHGVAAAVAYAVEHPQRVSHLILTEAYISGADFYETVPVTRAIKAMRELALKQWDLFTSNLGSMITKFNDIEEARKCAETFRSGMSAEALLSLMDASERIDIGNLLSSIKVPTLVVHNTSFPIGSLDQSRALASRIPEAEFVATDDPARAINDFLGLVESAASDLPSGMAVILFTDIVDSTALTERLGDTVFRTASRTLDEGIRAAIREAGGTPVEGKVLGDGVMGVFTTAAQAIAAARRCIELSAASELRLHVGLHAGDVIHEAGNVYGGAVNIASRICGLSAPDEILVSATVRELARTSAGVTFADRGERELKGIDDPVGVYEVRIHS